jgi:hypothetical protein
MELHAVAAPPLIAAGQRLRAVAGRIGSVAVEPDPLLLRQAGDVDVAAPVIGRVQSGGTWTDAEAFRRLRAALAPCGDALRQRFEWYVCRGAFFHTDAHYADVLFGVWYLAGPPVELVFPRPRLRMPLTPGMAAVFDPFEVHGVLKPGASGYQPADYAGSPPSVMAGFELELSERVREHFGIGAPESGARVVGSTTRVAAATGDFE